MVDAAIESPIVIEGYWNGDVPFPRSASVTGMSRDEAGTQKLVDMGVTVAIVNAFDGAAVEQALRRSQAAVVIDQLTVLPKDPAGYAAAFPGDR